MLNTLIKFTWPFILIISSVAHAESDKIPHSPPKGYVAICKSGNQTTVEPYEVHEARVARGWVPFTPRSSSVKEAVEEAAKRFEPFSLSHSLIIKENVAKVLEKAKFLDGVDIVLDEGEKLPPALKNGCEVKKLYIYHPAQLPYDFVFDANLWNAMSSAGQAAVLVNIGLSLSCDYFSCGPQSDEKRLEFRTIAAFSVSSNLSRMTAQEWFTTLNSIDISCVIYKRTSVRIGEAQFSRQTGSIEKAQACGYYSSHILGHGFMLKGSIDFYPNESVHRLSLSETGNDLYASYSQIALLGGSAELDPACEIELSEDQKLIKACVTGRTHLSTDHYDLSLKGESSFHSSGYVNEANGEGRVELNGRIVQIQSSDSKKLIFDPEGNILSGTLKTPVKIHGSHAEYELAAMPFTSYPDGRIRSAFLASDITLKNCAGSIQLFKAGSEIKFNEEGIPCEVMK
jgi:hypothetical protein